MTDAQPAPLPVGRFAGREEFQGLVRSALDCAVIEALNAWVRQGRRLTLLARTYDEVVRRHPRFVRWRGTWDHKITCRRSPAANAADIPSALWSPTWVLHRLDAERCVGMTGNEPNRRVLLRETLDEWLLRRSAPGFPATVLGL